MENQVDDNVKSTSVHLTPEDYFGGSDEWTVLIVPMSVFFHFRFWSLHLPY